MKINKLAIAVMTMALVVIAPVTAQAKTKTVSFDIDKVSANEFVQTVQSKGKSAHFTERDKNTYPIKITVKAKNKKDGRAKVKAFAKKVQKAKDNTYGLSYGVQYDDYNTDSFSNGVYTTNLFSTCNDIYFLNGITAKALNKEVISTYKLDGEWANVVGAYTKNLFPETKEFKNSSDSVKSQVILDYMGSDCMEYAGWDGEKFYDVEYPFTWKNAYLGKAQGVCEDFARMQLKAIRMIAMDYEGERVSNSKSGNGAGHSVSLIAVKNSKGNYDYFSGSNGGFTTFQILAEKEKNWENGLLDAWMINNSKEFVKTKLEKAAYKYGKARIYSELDEMILEYHK